MDNLDHNFFLELPALKVSQPLAEFYVVAISARDLLSVSFSEPLRYIDNSGKVQGSQRPKDEKRLKEIAKYIESVEMAFPNSIILGANYTPTGIVSKDESERWKISFDEACGTYKLRIPKNIPLAAIIDGQHRIDAFKYVTNVERFDNLQLLCSIYFDLPNSYQAFLFATINSNQKRVDRSLALEQFGYNVSDEAEKAWTPEKFSVFLSRKLNLDKDSPLYQHIKVTPLDSDLLFPDGINTKWVVSTATVVDGINSLITSNAKRDRIVMQQVSVLTGRSRTMIKNIKDVSPLRSLFIEGKDQTIYDTIINFFKAFKDTFWKEYNEKSYIFKTVGVQAGFDILKAILNKENNPNQIDFANYLKPATEIDFSDKFFQASGIGRGRIKNTIGLVTNLIAEDKLKKVDLPFYRSIIDGNESAIASDIMPWEEEAESAVNLTLEKTNWNYDTKTVSIDTNEDYQQIQSFRDFESFFAYLIDIADTAFENALPTDPDFGEIQKERFDANDVVKSCLVNYEANLEKMGWVQ